MKIAFYGTRGSTPLAEVDFARIDTNTSGVMVTFNTGRIDILYAGTGTRKPGNDLFARHPPDFYSAFSITPVPSLLIRW